MKKVLPAKGILATLGMILLILDTKTARVGAMEGVETCIRTVIPSLFPFLLLSSWLNDSFVGGSDRIPECIIRTAGLPKGSGSILVSSLLGGYPAGAQAVYRAYSNGALGKENAERILAYTNNAGPAFIFGMAGHLFPSRSAPWFLWGIHILSALMVRLVICPSEETAESDVRASERSADTVSNTAKTMCTICAWVIVFRIIVSYIDVWVATRVPRIIWTVLSAALELVNGCISLSRVDDLRVRFVSFSAMLAFGGLCVMMQTVSVVHEFDTGYYFMGKLFQTAFSIIISAAVAYHKWYLMTVVLIPAAMFSIRTKNKGRNPVMVRV